MISCQLLLLVNERVRVVVSCVHLLIHCGNTLRPSFELRSAVVGATSWLLLILRLLRLLLTLTIDVIVLHTLHEVLQGPIIDIGSIL